MGSGETAARETGDYIAWVFRAVVEGLEEAEPQPKCSQSGSVTPMDKGLKRSYWIEYPVGSNSQSTA